MICASGAIFMISPALPAVMPATCVPCDPGFAGRRGVRVVIRVVTKGNASDIVAAGLTVAHKSATPPCSLSRRSAKRAGKRRVRHVHARIDDGDDSPSPFG